MFIQLVGEDSAFRINGLFNHGDGWIDDAVTGEHLAPENNWATRAAFRTRFGDNNTAIVSWDHESLDQLAVATNGIVALPAARSEEHTYELQSLMRNSYAAFRLKKKKKNR